MAINNVSQIEILDFECYPDIHSHQRHKEEKKRWQYVFPFWIDYAFEKVPPAKGLSASELEAINKQVGEITIRLNCDFADLCDWCLDKGYIEDYCIEFKVGQVTIPGTTNVEWSEEKQDAVETHCGRYLMDFTDFLREFLTEKDLIEFVEYWRKKIGTQ